MLPNKVHNTLKDAAAIAQSTLATMSDYHGPKGPADRLEHYGLRVDFGNCVVNIQIEIPT